MSTPYGGPDPQADGFDYDNDGLPFDPPEGYEPGDYWLREQMLNAGEREATRTAWARAPRADEVADVLACLRAVLREHGGACTPEAFSRERIWDAAARLGYTFDEGRVLEKALREAGHVVVTRYRDGMEGEREPVCALAEGNDAA